ncbi:hypothetical protein K458DRAFT_206692 [Lentithecium fluviatile CBS 122367]|uniref:Uncharacterized protein n=1 Tax=Lentithecium fluviatile CBS 122367 TaxID=1168545 RepID=A0A6G1IC09_9PLEO|nr:hypothetical protein K458DRAFT_206692 [Lentithecium fluviatile CBS 122367]
MQHVIDTFSSANATTAVSKAYLRQNKRSTHYARDASRTQPPLQQTPTEALLPPASLASERTPHPPKPSRPATPVATHTSPTLHPAVPPPCPPAPPPATPTTATPSPRREGRKRGKGEREGTPPPARTIHPNHTTLPDCHSADPSPFHPPLCLITSRATALSFQAVHLRRPSLLKNL